MVDFYIFSKFSICYFVILPFKTSVKNKFLYFKSFDEIELKNI